MVYMNFIMYVRFLVIIMTYIFIATTISANDMKPFILYYIPMIIDQTFSNRLKGEVNFYTKFEKLSS